jgi:transcriptional regulator with XRE-family HTH domain
MSTKDDKQRRIFGEFLRRHRENLRPELNQTEAGARAGMSRTQWTRLELGESGTRRDNIPAIAKAIGADLRETYEMAGFAPPSHLVGDSDFEHSDFELLYRKHLKLAAHQKQELSIIFRMISNEMDAMLAEQESGVSGVQQNSTAAPYQADPSAAKRSPRSGIPGPRDFRRIPNPHPGRFLCVRSRRL